MDPPGAVGDGLEEDGRARGHEAGATQGGRSPTGVAPAAALFPQPVRLNCIGEANWRKINDWLRTHLPTTLSPETPHQPPNSTNAPPPADHHSDHCPSATFSDDYLTRQCPQHQHLWGMLDAIIEPDPELSPDHQETLRRLLKGR